MERSSARPQPHSEVLPAGAVEHDGENTVLGDNGGSRLPYQRRHAVIAGTGRAGTSFLVRFLDRCGLETDLAGSAWFGRARAGHEHALDSQEPVPYVVKDPLLFTYCAELDLAWLRIDALILPVRDLMLAASSRVHQERLALLDNSSAHGRNAQLAAATPGGVVYSLDVVDQARLLAVGFYRLLHWAIAKELPLFLLDFPRLVEDRDYTLGKLWPWLGEHCSSDVARRAFAEVADAGAVRMRPDVLSPGGTVQLGPGEPDPAALDRAALLERMRESDAALEFAQSEAAHVREEARCHQLELDRVREDAAALTAQLQAERCRGLELESALSAQRARAESATTARAHAERGLAEIQTTTSWRITAPLRRGMRGLRRLTGRAPLDSG